MNSRKVMHISTIIGLCCLPILLRRRYIKQSFVMFIFSAITNLLLANMLVERHFFRFPIRYFPKAFKSSISYDLLVGPLLSVAYCQTTSNSSYINIVGQGMIYSALQALIEYWMLIKTKLIRYNKKKWSVWHTLITLTLYKILIIRGVWTLIKANMPVMDEYKNSKFKG